MIFRPADGAGCGFFGGTPHADLFEYIGFLWCFLAMWFSYYLGMGRRWWLRLFMVDPHVSLVGAGRSRTYFQEACHDPAKMIAPIRRRCLLHQPYAAVCPALWGGPVGCGVSPAARLSFLAAGYWHLVSAVGYR